MGICNFSAIAFHDCANVERIYHLHPLRPLRAYISSAYPTDFSSVARERGVFARTKALEGELPKSMTAEKQASRQAGFQLVASLLDALDRPLLVSDRRGQILFTNLHAQDSLQSQGLDAKPDLNLFQDVLRTDRKAVLAQLEGGEQEVHLALETILGSTRARVRWLPEPDWLAVFIEPAPAEPTADEAEMRQKVQ